MEAKTGVEHEDETPEDRKMRRIFWDALERRK